MLWTDGEPQTDARAGGGVLQGEPHAGSAGRRDRSRPEAVAWSSRAGEGAAASGREAPGKDARPPVCLADGLGGRPPEPGLPSGGAEGSPTYGGQRVPWTLWGPSSPSEAGPTLRAPPLATRLLPSMRGRARLRAGGHAVCQDPGHELPSWVAVAAV